MSLEKRLLKLKDELEEKSKKKDKLEGRKEALYEQLKADYGCSTLKAAEAKLKKLETKHKRTLNTIEKELEELEEAMEED